MTDTMIYPQALYEAVRSHQYPLLFATISGAHLYGFPSPDSDFDLRGAHILPVQEVIGLKPTKETIEISADRENIELDLVTHDVKKFFLLLLKKNGYVLEQLYSPLLVHGSPEFDELKSIAKGCITKHHHHHYLGFAHTQWKLFLKQNPPRVKPLLYVYRVLFTGIHLMKTGTIEANILKLNEEFQLPFIDELVERKLRSHEKQTISDADLKVHKKEYGRLLKELVDSADSSHLAETASAKDELDDLLKRIRLKQIK